MQATFRHCGVPAAVALLFAVLGAAAQHASASSLRLTPVSIDAEDAPKSAAASEDVGEIEALRSPIRVEPLIGMWTPRAGGRVRLSPNRSDRIELGPGLSLDDKELTPNLEMRVRFQPDWEFTVGGFRFATDSSGAFNGPDATFGSIPLIRGEPFRSELTLDSIFIDASWRGGIFRIHDRERDGGEADFGIYPTLGLRWISVRHEVERPGFDREVGKGDWGSVTAGAHLRLHWAPEGGLPVTRGIGIEIGAGIGPAFGAGSGMTWHVRSGVRFEIFQNIDLVIAYRLLETDLRNRSDDYRFTAGLQGMFFSVGVRF